MASADNLGVVSTRLLTTHMARHMRAFTPAARAAFLQKLEETASVQAAADAAGVTNEYVRLHRRHDPDFAREWEAALDRSFDPRLDPRYQEQQP